LAIDGGREIARDQAGTSATFAGRQISNREQAPTHNLMLAREKKPGHAAHCLMTEKGTVLAP
jgi:hypothetical protein